MSKREPDAPGDLTRAIAEEVRAEMGRRKMSAPALAETSGLGLRSLRRYLNAERTFSLEVLDRMAVALGLTSGADIIVGMRRNPEPPESGATGRDVG